MHQREESRHGVVQLADVPGPRMTFEAAHRLVREGPLAAERAPEMLCKQWNVVATFPQRRQLDAGHRQAEERVVAETPLLHLPVEIPSSSRQNTDIDGYGTGTADADDLAPLQDAQQLRLARQDAGNGAPRYSRIDADAPRSGAPAACAEMAPTDLGTDVVEAFGCAIG